MSTLRPQRGSTGQTGDWLLDPYDLTVDASAASTISTNLGTSNVTLLTTASSASGPGVQNASGSGDITVNSAINWASANRLTLTAYRNVNIHAPITASGAGKVTITTGAGGDYSFGLTANGFRGALRFTGTAGSGQALTINGNNYTLLYSLANLGTVNGVAGNYALARPLDLSAAGTLSSAPAGNLAANANFTGLGNTVNAMTLSSGDTRVGLFSVINQGATLRDIGVTNSTLTTTNAAVFGGLLVGQNTGGTVRNAYATGTATGTGLALNSGIALLAGRNQGNGSTGLIDNAFAIGSVNVSGAATYAGGLVGSSRSFNGADAVIRHAFAVADVAANMTSTTSGETRIGGLVGESVLGSVSGAATLTDVYAMGTVRSSNSADHVGGLAGTVGSLSVTSNAMATTLVIAPGANTGGLTGFKSASGTITNSYYDAGTTGASNGLGTAQTTAQLQSGSLPGGFSPANWTTGATGLYPYLTSFYPNGLSAISGTAYLNVGTTVSDATIGFYTGGSAITTLGTVRSGANGYYYAVTPTGVLPPTATSQIGATLTLAGASAVSGLTYTGLPVVVSGNVTGLDLRENVFLATTGKTTNTALQTDINATLGSSTYTALRTTLASALWQINASGSFSVDSALGHTGHTGLTAAGNLSLDAAVTATGSTLMLTAGGTVTDGASGSITASNLALLGGAVTLDGSSNSVTTLAGSGLTSLNYLASGSITVGTVGPINTGVAAASIVGATSTITGITATTAGGDVTVKSPAGITVAAGITTNAGDITLWSNSAGAATGGIYVRDNVTLDSRTAADRTATNTSTASGGGAITLGGGTASTTLASGTVVPTGYAQNISGGAAGVQIGTFVANTGTNAGIAFYSGGGNMAISGQDTSAVQASVSNGIGVTGGVTFDAGTTGNITMTGANSAAPVYAAGIGLGTFQAYGANAGAVVLRTANGNIALNGTSTNATTGQSGVTLGGVSYATVTLAATGTGSVTVAGNAPTSNGGDVRLTAADLLAASGAITIQGTGGAGIGTGWGGGSSADYVGSLGSKAGSLVTSSSSNITLTDDKVAPANNNGLAFNTSGTATVQPYTNNFNTALSIAQMSFASTVSNLTLGRDIGATAHTDTINVDRAVSIAGPISVYAGTITTSAALQSTNAGADILLKSTAGTQVGGNITTDAGDITVWSNATDATTGGIYVLDNTQFDTRTAADRTAGNTSTASGGGAITLGGGSASSTLPSGTAVPTGAAQNISGRVAGIFLGTDTPSFHNANVRFYSGGGNIGVNGKVTGSASNAYGAGVAAHDGLTMDGGTSGSITLIGEANFASTAAHGVELSRSWSGTTGTVLRTANGSINLTGTASGATTNDGLSLWTTSAKPITIAATGTGSISLTGNGTGGSSTRDITVNGVDILAASGPITLTGTGAGSLLGAANGSNYQMSLGAKAGSLVTASTSNLTVTDDTFALAASNGFNFNTSGTATLQPYGNNFSTALNVSPMTFASTVSNLTLGKNIGSTAHTDTVNVNSAIAIAGPISTYAGTITTSAALTSTNAGADILLKSTAGTQVGGSITTNAGDITIWSNATDAATGGIYVLDNTTLDTRTTADRTAGNTSTASGGGSITLGGGSASAALASGTVVPTGYAQNFAGRGAGVFIGTDRGLSTVNTNVGMFTGGGDLTMRGQVVNSINSGVTASFGVAVADGFLLDGGTNGSITLDGKAQGTTTSNNQMIGVRLGLAFGSGAAASIARTANGDIRLIGEASGGKYPVGVFSGTRSTTSITLAATGSGSLSLTGAASGTSAAYIRDVGLYATNLLAAQGPITVTGTGAGRLDSDGISGAYTMGVGAKVGSLVTSSSSDVVFTDNDFLQTANGAFAFDTSGTVTLQPYGNNFRSTFNLTPNTFASTISNLTVGKDIGSTAHTDTLNLNVAVNIAGPINAFGNTITLTQAQTSASGIVIKGSGTVTDTGSGAVIAPTLLLNGAGNYTLDGAANDIGTLAATGTGALTYVDSNALTIGTLGSTSGVWSSGTLSIATVTGDLTLAQNVTTTTATSSAIVLNSGQSVAAGTAGGGNIVISGSPAISTGTGGRAILYSGSVTADNSLATLVGSGSGRFRYNSDEATSNYTAALGTGLYAIYREAPTLVVAVDGKAMVYGAALPGFTTTTSGMLNGDSSGLSGVSVAVGGARSSSNNYTAGAHTLTASGGVSGLGYAISYADGTLNVAQKAITVSGVTAGNKVYDGLTGTAIDTGGANYTGLVAGDDVALATSAGTFNNKNVGNNKTVTLANSYGGADLANYQITDQTSTTASITPKALTIGGITAANKVYDGNTNASVSTAGATFSGLVTNDQVTVSSSGSFADKNVANGKTVSLASTNGGADAGNYTITNQASTTANITPKALSIGGITAADRIYDGSTNASVSTAGATFSGLVTNDQVTVSSTGSFANKNVGNNKTVTLASTNGGADAGNYQITNQASTTADITPKALTIGGITAANREYDGSTNASVSTAGATYGGLVTGDVVTVSSTGSFANKNVGNNKTVTLASTNGGADAGNYQITNQASTTASITPKALTIGGITAANKVYDGNTNATVSTTGATYGGLITGDVVTVNSTGSFANKNVGNGKIVTLASSYGGADAGNYTITNQASTTANVTPKALSIGGLTAVDKVYDGNTSASINTTGATYSGLVTGDVVTVNSTGSFANKSVGNNKTVTLASSNGGADAGNYTITNQASTTANITPKALIISQIGASNRVYDGTTGATVVTGAVQYTGLVVGDDVALASSTGAFANKNVGTGKTVNLTNTYNGADLGNYTITDQASTTANITQAQLKIGTNSVSKVYDGTTSVSGGAPIAVGGTQLFGSDTLTGGTFAYVSKNVGTNKIVNVSAASVNDGNGGGNYAISYVDNTTSAITARALTIGGITAANREYDGSTNATVSTTGATYGGLVTGDVVTISSTGSFANKNVGNGKTVSLINTYGGIDAGNYTITNQASTTANITPKALIISQIGAANRVYDGTTGATVVTGSVQYTGLVVGDDVALASSTGAFANKNVGTGKTVTLTNTYNGADRSNYQITDQTSTTANITQATLKIGTASVSKVYDGTTSVSGGAPIAVGGTQLFGSDTLTGGTFAYVSKNVGTNKIVNVGAASVNDGNGGGNYAISYVDNTTSAITARALTIGGITAANKVYDGSTNATVSTTGATYSGLVAGDEVTVAASGSFANKNVGNNKTVTLVSTNGGADAGNYTITNQASTTANITPKALIVSQIGAANRVYDGTTGATVVTGSVQYTGLVVGDDVALASSAGAFSNKNVGTGKTVTLTNTYNGADRGNYTITDQTSTTANITQATLKIGTASVSKVYDGTTSVVGGAPIAVGGTQLFGSDTLTGGTFAYVSKNVGTNKIVNVGASTVNDGNGGGNYAISYVDNTTSAITARALTIGGITASNKVYDGATGATVSTTGATYSGLVAGDEVTVAASGSFANKNVGNGKTVTLASTNGGADAGNYTITNQASTTANITPKALIVSQIGAANRVYDGTTGATVVTGSVQYTGLVVGDDVALASSTGAFTNKNVGTGKTVTLTNTYNGADRANYTITDQASTTATITQAQLQISTGNVSKVYDGTTIVIGGAPIAVGGTQLFGSDTLTGGTFAYTSKNVGTSKIVNVGASTVNDGNGGGNYAISYVDNTTSTITPKALSVAGLTASNKVYDGNTNATVSTTGATYSGLVTGDVVTVSSTGSFADKNAGNGKTVTLASTYGGADAGNYTITNQASTTASITPKGLTVTANSDARFVTQSDTAGFNGVHYDGFVGGDTASVLNTSGLSVTRPNAGSDVAAGVYGGALVPAGVSSGNYAISYAPGTYTILAANNALVKTVNLDTAYGTLPGYTVASVQYMNGSNVISALTQSGHSGNSYSYSDGVGGTLSFTLNASNAQLSSGGNLIVGNYAIADANPVIGGGNLLGNVTFVGNLAVQARALAPSASGVTKVYDGTTAMSNVTLDFTGKLTNDLVTISGNGNFSQKNVGNNLDYSVTGMALGGADGANYYLSGGSSLSGNNGAITPKAVTVSGITAGDKVYDGSKTASVNTSGAVINGLVGTDDVGVSASGLFGDKNVGTGKTVTLSSSYSGADAGNYSFTNQATTTASITPKALTVSGLAVANRTYDGTTSAAVDTTGAHYAGLVSGDDLTVSATGAFANKNVGGDKLATLTSTYGGVDAGNYSITSQASTTGDITQAQISVSTADISKVYDGGTSAAGNATLVGGQLFGTDALNGANFAFSNKNAGAGNKTVLVSNAAIADGNNGGNYRVVYVNNTTSTITPKSVSVSGITAGDKVYDGGKDATVNAAGALIAGLVGSDDVRVIASGLFDDKNVGTGKTVTLSSSYSGADAGNYSFTNQTSTTASITPKALTVSGLAVANRTYDGTTSATVDVDGAHFAGLVSGDKLTVSASGTFANKNVGADKLATLTSTYGGADAGNYAITSQASTTGDIFAAQISVSTSDISKVYDGNTSAAGNATLVGGQLFGTDALNGASFAFSNKNAGAGNKTVLVSNAAIADGNNGGNYRVVYVNNTTSTITPKSVSVSGITAGDKVYDGGRDVTVNGADAVISGLVGNDDVHVIATGLFGDKNAGTGKTVTLNSLYSGADAGNYSFTGQDTTTANITPKALTVSGLAVANRSYDGTNTAIVDTDGAHFAGLVSGDKLTVSASGTFANKNVGGDKLATLTSTYGGVDAGNYAITSQASTTGDIFAAQISVSTSDISKVYDGNTSAAGNATLVGGQLFGSDALNGASFAFSNKNAGAGNKTVLVSNAAIADGNNGNNYRVVYVNNTTSTITPKAVSVSGITAGDKVYDGGRDVTVNGADAVISGLVGTDDVHVIATGLFGDKNAGTGKTVTLNSLYSGADAGNYSFTGQGSTTANITPKALTVSGLGVANRFYDGTTNATVDVDGVHYAGLVSGDDLKVSATGAFANKNVGGDKLALLTSSYSGADKGNYAITDQASTTGDIFAAAITLSSANVQKVYDGNTSAAGSAVVVGGQLFGGDTIGGGSFAFNNKNAGAGNKTVHVAGIGVQDGNGGQNYVVTYVDNTTSTITPRGLELSGLGGGTKVYDGTTSASLTGTPTLGNVVAGDTVQIGGQGSASFADKNAGLGKTITVGGYVLNGDDAANYQIILPTLTADITPRSLLLSGVGITTRSYDGSTLAIVDTSGAQYDGLLGGDTVQLNTSGVYDNRNAGSGKQVTLSSTLSGADAGNYTLGGQSSATGDITRAAISVSTANISKVYDGTTSANGSATLVGGQLFGGDTLSGGSFAYDNKNAGAGNKTVHVAGVGVLDGNASGNYDVSYVDNTSSTITARSLDLSGLTGGNKVYDGTTGAILIGTPTLGNLVAGDLVQIGGTGSAFFTDKNAGIGKTITVGGFMLTGADAANYQIDLPTLTADITPRQLQVSGGQAQNKPYDGTTGATVSGITLVPGGVLAGDQVGLLDEDKGQFASSGIGTNKPVSTAIGLSGADAGNYVLTQPSGLVASITSATNIGNVPGGPGSGPTDVIVLPNPLPTLPLPTPTPGGSGGLGGLPPVVVAPVVVPVAPNDAGFVLAASNSGAAGGEQARADGTQLVVHSLTILSTPAVAQAAGNDFVSVLSFEPFVARTGQLLAIALPRGTFEHSNPDEVLTYEARRSDGSALPDWLRFDGSTRSFSGTAPAGVQPLDITITARDQAGHTARTSIRLAFSS